MMLQVLTEKWPALLGVAVVGFSAISNPSQLQSLTQSGGDIRQAREADEKRLLELQQSAETKKREAVIAEQRYQDGCIMVVASNDQGRLTTLEEGQPVFDSARKDAFLPIGSVVCDVNGNTGEIVRGDWFDKNISSTIPNQPVVGKMAFTGNREVVDAVMRRRAAGARHNTPGQ